jgi:hypothetical protein
MAQVKYFGEFPEGKDTITQHGYEFEAGKAVNVTDKALIEKFAGNRFFEVSGESDKEQVKQGQDEAEKAETETLQAWLKEHQVPFHHKLGADKLRALKADYLKAQEKAQAE